MILIGCFRCMTVIKTDVVVAVVWHYIVSARLKLLSPPSEAKKSCSITEPQVGFDHRTEISTSGRHLQRKSKVDAFNALSTLQ